MSDAPDAAAMASESAAALESIGEDVLRQILRDNRAQLRPHSSFYELFMGFIHAIRWTEPWIISILVLHVLTAAAVVLTRRRPNVQAAIFLCICVCVYTAKYANAFLRPRWRELGFTQNYFDDKGIFISFVFSLPLLLIGFAQMLYTLLEASRLLIKVKRAELREHRRAAAQAAASQGATDGAPTAIPNGDSAPETKKDK